MRPIERVHRWLQREMLRYPVLLSRIWRVGDYDVVTDGSLMLCVPAGRGKGYTHPSAAFTELAGQVIDRAARVGELVGPKQWCKSWTPYPDADEIVFRGLAYQAPYLTAVRYVLGKDTRISTTALPEHEHRDVVGLVALSPRGTGVIMPLAKPTPGKAVARW